MTKESDLKALMTASLEGDSNAHRSLLTALSGHLRSYYKSRLLRSGRTAEETEDLVQEALIVIHTQRHTYDPEQPLTPWVYAIARYKLIDHLRRTRATTADVPLENADDILASDDNAAAESQFDLAKLLERLPERMRLSLQYVKLEGLSVAEAADRSGMSQSAVKVNVHRGLKILTALITRETKA
ncbi:sigma-70 family RNA polymerase sigma factor [Afipia sp. TerB]|jgi:RNA polymerase sigma-70 factor (ECF subfamily)|nr:sigma-70 family RNA polymerase sigma factor [Hyphomicrobiales bacterium]